MLYNNKDKETEDQTFPSNAQNYSQIIWKVTGADCASCAQKIEKSLSSIDAITKIKVNTITEKMVVDITSYDKKIIQNIEQKVSQLGYKIAIENNVSTSHDEHEHHNDHDHDHKHSYNMDRNDIIYIGVLGLFIAISFILSFIEPKFAHYAFIVTTVLGLIPFVKKVYFLVRSDNYFAIETLMAISATGALFINAAEEASMVLFLFMIGELLESIAANKARKGISALTELMPENVVLIKNGQRTTVATQSLQLDDVIEISSGGRLPADVELISEHANIDESPLTGESILVEYHRGDKIFAGSLIVDTTAQFKVISESGENAVDRILQLIEEADERKAPIERFIDKFSRYYTPSITLVALLIILIPPLFFATEWYPWIYKGLTLLLIGCPCALVISTPAAITSALSTAARQGVLIKGGATLELLGGIKNIVFDKTGTLTEGKPIITDIIVDQISEDALLTIAASIELGSHHPLAKAVIDLAEKRSLELTKAENRTAIAGIGISGEINQERIYIASPSKLANINIELLDDWANKILQLEALGKTVVIVVSQKQFYGIIALQDKLRDDAKHALNELNQLDIQSIMLTGDNICSASSIASELNIQFKAQLLPTDKLAEIEKMNARSPTAMVGDGINDSPAMKAATVGIAMGSGTNVALETADAALSKNKLLSVPRLIRLSRRTNRIIRQNITLALVFKLVFLITTLLGMTGLWIAVLADSGITGIVTANSLRLLKNK